MSRNRAGNLWDLEKREISDPEFLSGSLVGSCLFAAQRQPHKYGFAFSTLGTAPHLEVYAGTAFDQVQRADGFDLDQPGLALTKGVFELLERVWSPAVEAAPGPARPLAALGNIAADPNEFVMLSDLERKRLGESFVPYSQDTPLHWSRAWKIQDERGQREPTLIPSILVHPGFGIIHPEQRICPTLSSGLAAGASPIPAILRGLYEVVERDAAVAGWMTRIPPRRWPLSGLDTVSRKVATALEEDGFQVSLYDITLDIPIPVVMSVIRNDRRPEAFTASLGLGCHLDPGRAASKAFAESVFMMENGFEFPAGAEVVRKPDPDQGRGELLRSSLDDLEAMAEPGTEVTRPSRNFGSESEQLRHCLGELFQRGHRVYFADLTPEEAEGFSLCRVFVSRLQPMLYEAEARRLANPRLYDLPRRIGLTETTLVESDLNLSPHPFTQYAL